ncbi:hypothetical protein FRC07_012558 [Ceratobasidium sp. 392]|nr:hypothetical protein FRC07_012558 [Ceratobasidium sp. 392]
MSSPATRAADLEEGAREKSLRKDSGSEDAETSRTQSNDQITSLALKFSDEDIKNYSPKLRGGKLTGLLAFVAGTGFTLFGYDQGVLSALLTAEKASGVEVAMLVWAHPLGYASLLKRFPPPAQ